MGKKPEVKRKNIIPIAKYDKLRETCKTCKLRYEATINFLEAKIKELEQKRQSLWYSIKDFFIKRF